MSTKLSPDTGLLVAVGCTCLLVATLFALPSLIAFQQHDPNRRVILAFNASCVGWLVALALAVYPLIQSHRAETKQSVRASRKSY